MNISIGEELERRFLIQEEYLGNDKPVNKQEPLVSISVPTYQHAGYIRQCLDGILMQKTDFPYEMIIGEDESIDGTKDICIDYAEKHPDKIRLFLRDRSLSQYFENRKFVCRFNGIWNRMSSRGKYIAICEGDDYWTDPYKLQKQVDFLEANPEYGLVHGDCDFYFQDTNEWEYNANKNLANNKTVKKKEELFYLLTDATYKVRTATVMFKNELLKKIKPNTNSFLMGDTPMWLDFSQLTKFKYFDEVLAVYRILSESASRSKNLAKQYQFTLSMAEMRVYYSIKYSYPINQKLKKRYNKALITYKIYNKNYNELYPLINPLPFETMKFRCISMPLFRHFFLFKNGLKHLLITLIRKINNFLTTSTSLRPGLILRK